MLKTKLQNLLRSFGGVNRYMVVGFVLTFAAMGTYALITSHADPAVVTSTDPNTVVVQYALPHVAMPINPNNIRTPMASPPFTLYGNGLLVCAPFEDMATMPSGTMPVAQLTSKTLTQSQITALVQQIIATGFSKLDAEYYNQPVAGNQHIIQLNLADQIQAVAYYNDVPAPAAYTKVLSILQNTCSGATAPYVPAATTVRVKQSDNLQGQAAQNTSAISSQVKSLLQDSLAKAYTARDNAKNNVLPASGTTVVGEVDKQVNSNDAKALLEQLHGKRQGFVQQNGVNYQVAVDQPLPKPKNPLNLNYEAIRAQAAQKKVSIFGHKFAVPFSQKAYAASTVPLRNVILVPSDVSVDTSAMVAQANAYGQHEHDWYCQQVGKCYNFVGTTVVRGSQTRAYYLACHQSGCENQPLLAVMYNVRASDSGSIYTTSYDTQVMTAFSTDTLSHGACGWGYIGDQLSATDPFFTPGYNTSQSFCPKAADSAHENGHTFGLNHTGNGTLMDGSPYATNATYCDIDVPQMPVCSLDGGQAQTLATTPKFFAAAPPSASLTSAFQNGGSGRCMDVIGASTTSGTYMQIYDCNGSRAQSMSYSATDNSLKVVGNCLDVPGGNFSLGQRVWNYACNGTNAQKWQFSTDGTIRPTAASRFCLSPDSPANQAHLILYTCDGGPLQNWAVRSSRAPQASAVRSTPSGRCMDVPGSSTASGTYMQIYDCNGTKAQSMSYAASDSSLRVIGNCFDVPGGNFANGQKVWSYACNGSNAQKWQFNTDGTIRPAAALSLCLTAESTGNQAQLSLSSCNGNGLQNWSF